MTMNRNLYLKLTLCCFLLFSGFQIFGQGKDTSLFNFNSRLVQFSGIIVTADSLRPIPYVNIRDNSTGRGTVSDYYGFFSFVAMKGDTVTFSCVGFKKSVIIIPDSLTENRYSLIQMMQGDTVLLPVFTAYPWPSKEQFATAFVNLDLPDDYLARMEKNVSQADLRIQAEGLPSDPRSAFYTNMQKEQYRMYYAGQIPPNNLLNPIAWYKFVQSWKNGDFKKQ